jgi:hypothetical protein
VLNAGNEQAFMLYLDRMDPEFSILAWQLGIRRDETLVGTKGFIKMAQMHQATFAAANRG